MSPPTTTTNSRPNLTAKPPCHTHLHHSHRCFLPFFATTPTTKETIQTAPALLEPPLISLSQAENWEMMSDIPTMIPLTPIEQRVLRSAPPLSLVSFGEMSFSTGSRCESEGGSQGSWSGSNGSSRPGSQNSEMSEHSSTSTDGWAAGMISPRTRAPPPPVLAPVGSERRSQRDGCSKSKRRRSRPAPITVFSPTTFMNRRARVLSYSPVDLASLAELVNNGPPTQSGQADQTSQTLESRTDDVRSLKRRKQSEIMHTPAFLLHTIEDLLATPALTPAYVASLQGLGVLPDPSPTSSDLSLGSASSSTTDRLISGKNEATIAYQNLQGMWRGPATGQGEESAAMSGISWFKDRTGSPSSVYSTTIPPTPSCVKARQNMATLLNNTRAQEVSTSARKESSTLGPYPGVTIIQPRTLPFQPAIKSGNLTTRVGTSLAGIMGGLTPRAPKKPSLPGRADPGSSVYRTPNHKASSLPGRVAIPHTPATGVYREPYTPYTQYTPRGIKRNGAPRLGALPEPAAFGSDGLVGLGGMAGTAGMMRSPGTGMRVQENIMEGQEELPAWI